MQELYDFFKEEEVKISTTATSIVSTYYGHHSKPRPTRATVKDNKQQTTKNNNYNADRDAAVGATP